MLFLLLLPQHFFPVRPAPAERADGKNDREATQRRGGRERGNAVPGCRERSDRLARRSAATDQSDAAGRRWTLMRSSAYPQILRKSRKFWIRNWEG